jgi:hypothetical protein
MNGNEFDDEVGAAVRVIAPLARPLSSVELKTPASRRTTGDASLTAMATQFSRTGPMASRTGTQASRGGARSKFVTARASVAPETEEPKSEVFEALAFCMQAVLLRFARDFRTLPVFNAIITRLDDLPAPPLLAPLRAEVFRAALDQKMAAVWANDSAVFHIIKRIFRNVTPEGLNTLSKLIEAEAAHCSSKNRSVPLITRAIATVSWTPEKVAVMASTPFASLVRTLSEINEKLLNPELKKEPEVYSDLLFRKAELLAASPDARVAVLLELEAYHQDTRFMSEAVMSRLNAAALVAEYLVQLGRMPNHFPSDSPAQYFVVACPSAASEACPPEIIQDPPSLPGFCTGKYFSEYGLIYLLVTTAELCKRATMYELSSKIVLLLSPIAESRRLWAILQKHFATGVLGWKVIEMSSTSSDRALGSYYRVQLTDPEAPGGLRTFIYRETGLANLWQVNERLKNSAKILAGNRAIEIINEGEELNLEKLDKDKYYVHVKAVTQYFTSDERKSRVTVFEQNHNVVKFYFDVPYQKSSQASIEHCWLRRTIFTLPHPMPYIVKRVEVPPENIEKVMFSPIEYSCQNLQAQVDRMEEAMSRKDFTALQPLLQGSLLTQVNEGPKKIAEVFLMGDQEKQNDAKVAELRQVFRTFLDVQQRAVVLHDDFAQKTPVYRILQENLVDGLNRITTTLQPYLT